MTFDAMSNSPSHSQREYKEIWSENLVIYQKSLKAFLQAPLQLFSTNQMLVFGERGKPEYPGKNLS